MPNPPQTFNINAQGGVSPSGNGAQMSITGAGNLPNSGQWHTATKAATIKLPSSVWNVTPNDGTAYAFEVPANTTSAVFTLKSNAPLGTQTYYVDTGPDTRGGNSTPSVVVDP